MIIPAGKRRGQVNQGGFKHESFLDADLFSKIAGIDKEALVGLDDKKSPTTQNTDLNNTMSDSSSSKINPKMNDPQQTPQQQDWAPQSQGQGTGQGQGQANAGFFAQQLQGKYGERAARIIVNFLEEIKEAGLLGTDFIPDPVRTKFTFGGGSIELIVPSQATGQKAVTKM